MSQDTNKFLRLPMWLADMSATGDFGILRVCCLAIVSGLSAFSFYVMMSSVLRGVLSIVVADAHLSDESDRSMASSLVIMPQSAHTDTSGQFIGQGIEGGNQVQGHRTSTLTSGTLTAGTLTVLSSSSGIGSDGDSEISILSIPSSDGEVWEDVASQVEDATTSRSQGQAIDYVLLYDDRSSEDE